MLRSCLVLVVVASACTAGCYQRRVSKAEIEVLLADATVRGKHLMDDYTFVRTYSSNGTFEQVEGPHGFGRWYVAGEEICIQWAPPYPKADRVLCRRMYTDDAGRYWKEFTKRNGDDVEVVEYSSFVGSDGVDRRVIPGRLERWKRWILSWRGFLLGLGLFILFLIVRWRYRAGEPYPNSFRNRWRKRHGHLEARGRRYRYDELRALDLDEQSGFLAACLFDQRWVDAGWVLESIFEKTDRDTAIATAWTAIGSVSDETAQRALRHFLDHFPDSKENIRATKGDTRFAYLLGKAYADRATHYQHTDPVRFEADKKLALEHFEHVRSHAPAPPPNVSELAPRDDPYRTPPAKSESKTDYSALVGAAYEAMMYATFTPLPHRLSSSTSGGG